VKNVFLKKSHWTARIALGVIALSGSVAWAQADIERIRSNIAPVGEVCLAGENCTRGAAVAATAAQPVPTPAAAAPAAPQPEPTPAAAPAADAGFDVAGAYQLRCFACHGTGAAGAPVTGNAEQWGERMAKGMDAVMANAINGLNAMPPRGLCMDCSDDQLRALIDYMVAGGQ
jgi:cytochrome c5